MIETLCLFEPIEWQVGNNLSCRIVVIGDSFKEEVR